MSAAQTFWRYHNKPRSIRPRHVLTHNPMPGTVEHVRLIMKQAITAAVAAGLPRPLFPFAPADVEAIYTYKRDVGAGLWFALIDGRVVQGNGELDSNDPDDYNKQEEVTP